MTRGELTIFALLGFGVWLSGAFLFRFGGHLMFESGPWITALSALGIAISVCVLLRATMEWRKAPPAQSVPVAVVMALPGLFGDVPYILAFSRITRLRAETAASFAAVLIFGNAMLLLYALIRARRVPRPALVAGGKAPSP